MIALWDKIYIWAISQDGICSDLFNAYFAKNNIYCYINCPNSAAKIRYHL